MSLFSVLLFAVPLLIFVAIVIQLIFYIIAGIRLMQIGKRESSPLKVRSGRISVLNAGAGLVILLALGYVLFSILLSWEV